jgi:hypothetical protein
MMMIQKYFLFTFLTLTPVQGFHVMPKQESRIMLTVCSATNKKNKNTVPSTTENPFRPVDIDLEKARDYANHFGKYSAKDVEQMRDGKF